MIMDADTAIRIAEQAPEVVAARAAVLLLMQQETVLSREVDRLGRERKGLQTDLASMLITKQDTSEALHAVRATYEGLEAEAVAVHQRVTTMKENAAALSSHRDQLTSHVTALHGEIELLERARIGASRAAAAATGVDRRRAPSAPTITADGEVQSRSKTNMQAEPEVEAAEDAAFDSFFNTDLEHDKSRDWILSDVS
jgi:chromosome segregation ATPase